MAGHDCQWSICGLGTGKTGRRYHFEGQEAQLDVMQVTGISFCSVGSVSRLSLHEKWSYIIRGYSVILGGKSVALAWPEAAPLQVIQSGCHRKAISRLSERFEIRPRLIQAAICSGSSFGIKLRNERSYTTSSTSLTCGNEWKSQSKVPFLNAVGCSRTLYLMLSLLRRSESFLRFRIWKPA